MMALLIFGLVLVSATTLVSQVTRHISYLNESLIANQVAWQWAIRETLKSGDAGAVAENTFEARIRNETWEIVRDAEEAPLLATYGIQNVYKVTMSAKKPSGTVRKASFYTFVDTAEEE